MEEIWKDIEGYEGLYQVSNLGRVKGLDRYITDINKTQFIKGRILSNCDNGNGYKVVYLCKDGQRKTNHIHRLVANAFIQNTNNLETVNHKDFNRSNNCVLNLEWCSQRENIQYSLTANRYNGVFDKWRNIRRKALIKEEKKYEKYIINEYVNKNRSTEQIVKDIPLGKAKITKILKMNGINIRGYKLNPLVQMKKGKIINYFDNSMKASQWLLENNMTKSKYAYETIRDCLKGVRSEAYGFEWRLE